MPDREPTLDEIEATLAKIDAWPESVTITGAGWTVTTLLSKAPEWLAYLCTRVREAEAEGVECEFCDRDVVGGGTFPVCAQCYNARAEAAEARVTALEDALRFYADPDHWTDDDWGCRSIISPPDYADGGATARAALAGSSQKPEGTTS